MLFSVTTSPLFVFSHSCFQIFNSDSFISVSILQLFQCCTPVTENWTSSLFFFLSTSVHVTISVVLRWKDGTFPDVLQHIFQVFVPHSDLEGTHFRKTCETNTERLFSHLNNGRRETTMQHYLAESRKTTEWLAECFCLLTRVASFLPQNTQNLTSIQSDRRHL